MKLSNSELELRKNPVTGSRLIRLLGKHGMVGAVTSGLLFSSGVSAQAPETDSDQSEQSSSAREEGPVKALAPVIVKSSAPMFGFDQELAKIPGSISVIQSDVIEAMNLKELSELNARIPGVALVSAMTGASAKSTYIRGVGKFSEIYGRSVAINIDGIPQNLLELQNPGISGEVESIEILKGPQQILNGRSGAAGAINIYTKQPTESGGVVGFSLGNDGYVNTHARYSHVFNENFSLGMAVSRDKDDGWVKNVRTGKELADHDRKNFSVTGIMKPAEDTKITVNLHGFNLDEGGPLVTTINPEIMKPYRYYNSAVGLVGEPLKFGQVSHDTESYTDAQVRGASVDIRHDLGGVELQSTTGWTRYKDRGMLDIDGGDNPDLKAEMSIGQQNYLLNQNFRLSSNEPGPWQWVVGVDGYYNRYDSRKLMAGAGDIDFGTRQDQKGFGGYGQVNWYPNEHFDFMLGARYEVDRTHAKGKGFQEGKSLSVTDKTFLLSGMATWHINEQALIYASVAESYFPTDIYAVNELSKYKKETGVTTELGFKSRWFEDRLYTAIAIYEGRYKNPVYTLAIPYSVWSVDKQRNRGFEIEVNFQATSELELGASYSRSNPKITSWKAHPELEGAHPVQLPLSQANANATYRKHFPIGRLTTRLDVNHMGKHYGDNANIFESDSYTIADLSLSLQRGKQTFTLWGKNITDKEYYALVSWINTYEAQASYGRGRSFGVNYQLEF